MGRAHEVRKVAMAKTAAAKAKLYSRYGKEIYLAAKAGGTDPDGNLALRRIIAKAKKEQVPADVIKRAVDKVKSGATEDYQEKRFESANNSLTDLQLFNQKTMSIMAPVIYLSLIHI